MKLHSSRGTSIRKYLANLFLGLCVIAVGIGYLGNYLDCYDLTAHTFKAETLNKPYERFVQAKGSWQLYYCDDENYYFLEVK